ncbi:MAG TPA: metallophosphoesterase, partial [Rugosimonospora sp.]|nr:metallophosphoesterase [Rugosimonospora sp.]
GLDRRMAKGLHRWPGSPAWLHVSAGLGTHPTAPVRFACPPEASVLTLIPR